MSEKCNCWTEKHNTVPTDQTGNISQQISSMCETVQFFFVIVVDVVSLRNRKTVHKLRSSIKLLVAFGTQTFSIDNRQEEKKKINSLTKLENSSQHRQPTNTGAKVRYPSRMATAKKKKEK